MYNGWPNYETWNVMLWMDNEEGNYRHYRERVDACQRRKLRVTGVRAKAWCEACMGDRTGDAVSLSNSRIRWASIAAAMREN